MEPPFQIPRPVAAIQLLIRRSGRSIPRLTLARAGRMVVGPIGPAPRNSLGRCRSPTVFAPLPMELVFCLGSACHFPITKG
jgi:hypothetical protein